jgi:hypothetical protein
VIEPTVDSWWYLSFAGVEGFRGGTYVRAFGEAFAVARATDLGINPGGEVMIVGPLTEATMGAVPAWKRERLLSSEELD